ncbi:ArsR/SmtB family transcription factor [Nonomuraea africana]|uniref:DNA-binding transcriptional ArsR family regulator n=1 Tax=Nonomuraea africana TaxID=46171 RepID=A0ABR9KGS8_9ACTN|nr:helix-turn-helix domain-containing protein [Nonomuraea africana]MBE1561030.1 DNA-binding transcriptional ArsR family regulator [Nonomuraea africana]
MRSLPQPKATDLDLVAVLHALGEPVRLELVRWMAAEGEVPCSPEHLDVPRSTLSNHWRVLREAGLTWTRAEGKARYMTLRREDLEARFPGVLASVLAAAISSGTTGTDETGR